MILLPLIQSSFSFGLQKVLAQDLFEFYLIEDKSQKNAQNVFQGNLNLHKNVISYEETTQEVSQLSHQKIYVSFRECFIKEKRDFSLIEKLLKLKRIKKQKTKNYGNVKEPRMDFKEEATFFDQNIPQVKGCQN